MIAIQVFMYLNLYLKVLDWITIRILKNDKLCFICVDIHLLKRYLVIRKTNYSNVNGKLKIIV